MALTTPNMGLIAWNQPTDPYDSTQLAGNFAKVDEHDHTPNKGLPITTAAIADGAITTNKLASDLTVPPGSITSTQLASNSVSTGNVIDGSLLANDLSSAASDVLGITSGGVVRRGKSIIATTETRSSASYGLMTTPDQVSNVVLPTDGLIVVAYQATWQESVANAARAAIFIGTHQQSVAHPTTPQPAAALTNGAPTGTDVALATMSTGLVSCQTTTGYTGDVTTGQAFGVLPAWAWEAGTSGGTLNSAPYFPLGGPCYIFAAAGTYAISIQFKASSGSVTAKNRKLWVWTLGF